MVQGLWYSQGPLPLRSSLVSVESTLPWRPNFRSGLRPACSLLLGSASSLPTEIGCFQQSSSRVCGLWDWPGDKNVGGLLQSHYHACHLRLMFFATWFSLAHLIRLLIKEPQGLGCNILTHRQTGKPASQSNLPQIFSEFSPALGLCRASLLCAFRLPWLQNLLGYLPAV